jgi:hypothetical protein
VKKMTTIQSWGSVTISSLQNLWSAFIEFLPSVLGALIVLVVGWIIAVALGRLTVQILRAFRIDQMAEKMGFKKAFQRAGYELTVTSWVGGLVRWFLIIVFVMAAADIIGLTQVTEFLSRVVLYIPNIIVAAVILLAAMLVANFLGKVVYASVKMGGLRSADFVAAVTRWSVMVFAVLAALDQLGVARPIIGTLVTGFVAMIALAGGLAFGLGGRDLAASILKKAKKEISEE